MKYLAALFCFLLPQFVNATTVTGTTAITVQPATGSACPATSSNGALVLAAVVTRSSGISPLTVFFDARATTDSSLTGNQTVVQDVTFVWSYGDTGVSGTGVWPYGNPAYNSKNSSTGITGAHTYFVADSSPDVTAQITVTAYDGAGNTASCTLAATTYSPNGANGFATTVCVYNATPGTGCPSGATNLMASSFIAGLGNTDTLNNKRVLFKCGDSFSGGTTSNGLAGVKWSVGAYGACPGTQSGLPQVGGTVALNMNCDGSGSVSHICDGRVSDLQINSGGSLSIQIQSSYQNIPEQMTYFNLLSTATNGAFWEAACVQCAFEQLTAHHMTSPNQQDFFNLAGNMCQNASTSYNCGQGSSPVFFPIGFLFIAGSVFDGTGSNGGTNGTGCIETVRIPGGQEVLIKNDLFENANNCAAVLKFHNNNTQNTQNQYIGQPNQYWFIEDSEMTGQSGAECVEISPQNNQTDEHIQLGVFERNYVHGCTGGTAQLFASCHNCTFRDNVFNGVGLQFTQRGSEFTPVADYPCANAVGACPGAPPTNGEFYNNTWVNGEGLYIDSHDQISGGAGINSIAQNNLVYGTSITNQSSSNTIANNSASTSANPGFTNSSGSFLYISDYKPTANYGGAANNVPVIFDAAGVNWSPSWNLGALHF